MGYAAAGWVGFASATATAAAALAGFLFIAISINLAKILDSPSLPGRAGLTLMLLATPLITTLLVLAPGQGRTALGAEMLGTGLVLAAVQLWIDTHTAHSEYERAVTWLIGRITPAAVCCGCVVIAGVTLLSGAGGGLYWLVPSVIGAFVSGLVNVWVLLVEILR